MKLLKYTETENYREIEIEKKFLFTRYKVTYRKIGDTILKYYPDGHYRHTEIMEGVNINCFFNKEFKNLV